MHQWNVVKVDLKPHQFYVQIRVFHYGFLKGRFYPDGSCVPACDWGQQVRKSGSYVSCRTCPYNSQPYSDYCRDSGGNDNLNSGNCSNGSYSNKYLEFPEGNPDDINYGTLKSNNYNEKCYNTNTPTPDGCFMDNQSKIGGECKCTGVGMDRIMPQETSGGKQCG